MNNLNQSNNTKNETLFIILGWICIAMSVLFVPIIFGAGGVACGYLLRSSGKVQHGVIMMMAAIVCGVFGVILGMAYIGY